MKLNLQITGRHVEVTPALKDKVMENLEHIVKHFDKVIDAHVVLSVTKLVQKVEATLHVPGHTLHAQAEGADMYNAIDVLADKLNRQIVKTKERMKDHHKAHGALKHQQVLDAGGAVE